MTDALHRLAERVGILTSYLDVDDRRCDASTDALVATLRALGVDIATPDDADDRLREVEAQGWERLLPPVAASLGRDEVELDLRVPRRFADGEVTCWLEHEDGASYEWHQELAALPVTARDEGHVALALRVGQLPLGYHRLEVDVHGRRATALLIVAPSRAHLPSRARRAWGVFLPLHALRTARTRGHADLTDLATLARWVGEQGGAVVGTLPLLPGYLGGPGEPLDPSPYSAVTRLFWNELVLDLELAPEMAGSAAARELLDRLGEPATVDGRHLDHGRIAAERGAVLRELAATFFDQPGERRAALEAFVARRPDVEDYALFRGAVARYGPAWGDWPAGTRAGEIGLDQVDATVARTHLYGQLLADEQVAGLSNRLRAYGQLPYLDLPIGTRADGYDAWRYPEAFALDVHAGAPPDRIFTGGQNWHFPPLHPQRQREDGYRYVREVLGHHLALADVLRIDHVMGLHRLFWIAEGLEARDGVYVRYPVDELYAVLLLEAQRAGSAVVGENLGTVPDEVEDALRDRGVARLYVVEYEADPDEYEVLPTLPDDVIASIGTHDMPQFASWWRGEDIDDSIDLGLTDEAGATRERARRGTVRWKTVALLRAAGVLDDEGEDPAMVLPALVEWLGRSPAPVVLVDLEDLWLERAPQNTPGTESERPNWRRLAALTFEELSEHPQVARTLGRLQAARAGRDARDE